MQEEIQYILDLITSLDPFVVGPFIVIILITIYLSYKYDVYKRPFLTPYFLISVIFILSLYIIKKIHGFSEAINTAVAIGTISGPILAFLFGLKIEKQKTIKNWYRRLYHQLVKLDPRIFKDYPTFKLGSNKVIHEAILDGLIEVQSDIPSGIDPEISELISDIINEFVLAKSRDDEDISTNSIENKLDELYRLLDEKLDTEISIPEKDS